MESGQGILLIESDNYLKSNEVIQFQNGFVLSTIYGLFFMEIETKPDLYARVYAYSTMNQRSPKEEIPLLELSGMN